MKRDGLGAKEMARREESMRFSTANKSGPKQSQYPLKKKGGLGGKHVRPSAPKS